MEEGEENGVQVSRVKLDQPYTLGLIRALKAAGLTFTVMFNAGEHEGVQYDSFFIEGGEGMAIALGHGMNRGHGLQVDRGHGLHI